MTSLSDECLILGSHRPTKTCKSDTVQRRDGLTKDLKLSQGFG